MESVGYRVYFEEAGQGIPLLCRYTAGSDGRQYRHLLENSEITEHFRVIAADLPYRGKSLPPFGLRWWEQEYKLTADFFKTFILAMSEALELDQPVFMGCSMGGHLAADLALNHPDRFRACIALEGALESHAIQGVMAWWNHPRLGNDSKPSLVYTETAQDIDTGQVGFYVLSGEYDWSAYPEAREALARKVKGSQYTLMRRMGHFSMSENPVEFTDYLRPVLDEIRSR